MQQLIALSHALGNALDDRTSLHQALWKHLPVVVGDRSFWVLIRQNDAWDAVVHDAASDPRPLEAIERIANRAVGGSSAAIADAADAGVDVCFPMLVGGAVVGVLGVSAEPALAEDHRTAIAAAAAPTSSSPTELRARVGSSIKMKRFVDELDNAAASIVALGATIEARDRYTNGHRQRLADYAAALGVRAGVDAQGVRALRQGGYLHDLGKIAIPDAVLFKPGPLTRDEFELIKSHPLVGDRICAPLRTLDRVRSIIRSHHETLDGRGYPDGLRGSAVPLLAQIAAIADIYDALTTERAYRSALGHHVALQMLFDQARSGKHDLALLDQFVAVLDAAPVTAADAPLAHTRSASAPVETDGLRLPLRA